MSKGKSDPADQPIEADYIKLTDGSFVKVWSIVRITPLDQGQRYELHLSTGATIQLRKADGERIIAVAIEPHSV